MSGSWIPSLRAVMLFAMIALLAFSVAKIAALGGIVSGKDMDFSVAAKVNPDTPRFAIPIPGQQAVEMLQNPAADDRELGAWLLMIFGLGAVAFALRCRRSEPTRHQFV